MGDIINLRRARKVRERDAVEAQADANRRKFGRTKVERKQTEADRTRASREHEGKKLEP